ncbi:unnamed protein product [Amoebophrya sp. A25]|nr:unnamed protein product [Amoebophrya sp. A25]|eukprot:GSA25T00025279001.1
MKQASPKTTKSPVRGTGNENRHVVLRLGPPSLPGLFGMRLPLQTRTMTVGTHVLYPTSTGPAPKVLNKAATASSSAVGGKFLDGQRPNADSSRSTTGNALSEKMMTDQTSAGSGGAFSSFVKSMCNFVTNTLSAKSNRGSTAVVENPSTNVKIKDAPAAQGTKAAAWNNRERSLGRRQYIDPDDPYFAYLSPPSANYSSFRHDLSSGGSSRGGADDGAAINAEALMQTLAVLGNRSSSTEIGAAGSILQTDSERRELELARQRDMMGGLGDEEFLYGSEFMDDDPYGPYGPYGHPEDEDDFYDFGGDLHPGRGGRDLYSDDDFGPDYINDLELDYNRHSSSKSATSSNGRRGLGGGQPNQSEAERAAEEREKKDALEDLMRMLAEHKERKEQQERGGLQFLDGTTSSGNASATTSLKGHESSRLEVIREESEEEDCTTSEDEGVNMLNDLHEMKKDSKKMSGKSSTSSSSSKKLGSNVSAAARRKMMKQTTRTNMKQKKANKTIATTMSGTSQGLQGSTSTAGSAASTRTTTTLATSKNSKKTTKKDDEAEHAKQVQLLQQLLGSLKPDSDSQDFADEDEQRRYLDSLFLQQDMDGSDQYPPFLDPTSPGYDPFEAYLDDYDPYDDYEWDDLDDQAIDMDALQKVGKKVALDRGKEVVQKNKDKSKSTPSSEQLSEAELIRLVDPALLLVEAECFMEACRWEDSILNVMAARYCIESQSAKTLIEICGPHWERLVTRGMAIQMICAYQLGDRTQAVELGEEPMLLQNVEAGHLSPSLQERFVGTKQVLSFMPKFLEMCDQMAATKKQEEKGNKLKNCNTTKASSSSSRTTSTSSSASGSSSTGGKKALLQEDPSSHKKVGATAKLSLGNSGKKASKTAAASSARSSSTSRPRKK